MTTLMDGIRQYGNFEFNYGFYYGFLCGTFATLTATAILSRTH